MGFITLKGILRLDLYGYLHIDLRHTTDEQLQFALVKDVNEVLGDELAEARHEGIELFLDTTRDTVLDDAVDVVLLVLLRDGNVLTIGLKLNGDHLTEPFLGSGERLVDDIGDVVLPV